MSAEEILYKQLARLLTLLFFLQELLALRNQDNKAKKRVQVMLKRTKSANKSVIDDAIDTVNTADTINGE